MTGTPTEYRLPLRHHEFQFDHAAIRDPLPFSGEWNVVRPMLRQTVFPKLPRV